MTDRFDGITRVNPGFKKPSFSSIEIRDILISMLVLAVAFTIIFARSNKTFFNDDIVLNTICWMGVSLVLVATSFLAHEFGHKFMAQKYGAWAEYRMFPGGLLLCIVCSVIGFLFAAPGAVYIQGRISDKMNGIISAAGPGVNIVIGAVMYLAFLSTTGYVSAICGLFAYLNSFLALFNMIPLMPFDGSKIIKWNIGVYLVMVAASGALLYLTF